MRSNPYVFVVGCPRSGTTLLQRMLDAHPQLAVANDTHFVTRVIARFPDDVDPPLSEELVDAVVGYHRFRRLGLSEAGAREEAAGARTYSEFVSRLYDRFARERGKRLGGEKTPDYVRHIARLAGLFPRARFVHIVRDGRDVALSVLDWARADKGPGRFALWSEEPVAVCGLWWRWLCSTGRAAGAELTHDRYHEVSYEQFVAEPERTLRSVANFLELPFADEMLAFNRGRQRADPGLSAKKAWLPPKSGLRDWRRDLSRRDVELFEALAGDALEEFGFARHSTPSPEVLEVARRAREWWQTELARRAARAARIRVP